MNGHFKWHKERGTSLHAVLFFCHARGDPVVVLSNEGVGVTYHLNTGSLDKCVKC